MSAEDKPIRSLREDELTRLAMGWQLPYLSFGEQIRSMATELLGWRTLSEQAEGREIQAAEARRKLGLDRTRGVDYHPTYGYVDGGEDA